MMNMKFKLILWIVVLFTSKASAHWHTAYSHNDQSQIDNRNWMRYLDPKTPLRELSLPGTHNSMARYFHDSIMDNYVSCQILTLSTQLRAGIRVFDIRCRHIDNVFAIHHGQVYLQANFNDIMREMVNFLKQNPSETLLVRITEEIVDDLDHDLLYSPNTRSFEDTFLVYRSGYSDYIWALIKENPTLEEVRGKIVILQDFKASILYGLDYRSFLTQDYYDLDNNWSLYYKWLEVKKKLISANKEVRTGFHVNYLSGAFKKGKGPVFPYFVASGHSDPGTSAPRLSTGATTPGWESKYPDFPRVACFIGICTIAFEGTNILTYEYIVKNQLIKFVGIIMIDFPGDGLIDAIIRLNYQKNSIFLSCWNFKIVSKNSGKCLDVHDNDVYKNEAKVQQWNCKGADNQLWLFDRDRIINLKSMKCLDARDRHGEGTKVSQWECNESDDQKWTVDGDLIKNKITGKCLDVFRGEKENEVQILHSSCNGGDHQKWRIEIDFKDCKFG